MEINTKSISKNHSIKIQNRDKIEVLGAIEVLSSTDKEIIAKLQDNYIYIFGSALSITKLAPEETLLLASGNITGLKYESKLTKKSFLKKVFK
jgi:hypothetical protein